MSYENPWLYNGEIFDSDRIENYYGFVYLIENLVDNRKYIGKKLFYSRKTKVVKKRKKKINVESDWKRYYGSNIELIADVDKHGLHNFRRTILRLCNTKGECNYFEAKEQFALDVLRSEEYYNSWIMCKIHKSHVAKTIPEEE
jgi:hypothetical protein